MPTCLQPSLALLPWLAARAGACVWVRGTQLAGASPAQHSHPVIRRVVTPGSGNTSGRRMLVPTEADASWAGAGGKEAAYVRFRIEELKAE